MEKEENQTTTTKDHQEPEKETAKPEENLDTEINQNTDQISQENKEPTPEEKIIELEDKVARAFAEMENQRKR